MHHLVKGFSSVLVGIIVLGSVILPEPALASTKTLQEGTINSSALETTLSRPTITGTATETNRVKLLVYREGSTKVLYRSRNSKVSSDGTWNVRVSRSLLEGSYTLVLVSGSGSRAVTLDTETLTVSKKHSQSSAKSKAVFLVSSVPLLSGGSVRNGAVVPVSYLQITNTGSEQGAINGFWLAQKGTAKESLIQALSTVDDSGKVRKEKRNEGTEVLFENAQAFAPTSLVFMPGEMRLFTVKAEVASLGGSEGETIHLQVTSIDSTGNARGNFPIVGAIWTLTK